MTEYIEAVARDPVWLGDGGFAPETEVLTTAGPVSVAELESGMVVYALAPSTRVVKRKPVVAVDAMDPRGAWACLSGRRFDFRVLPGHRVLYQTKGNDRLRFRPAGELGEQTYYRFVNEWTRGWGGTIAQVDVRKWLDEFVIRVDYDGHGHSFRAALPDECTPLRGSVRDGFFFDPATFQRYDGDIRAVADSVGIQAGLGHRCQPVVLPGTAFLEFLGWFATEGSVTWKSDRDTAEIRIAQSDDAQRAAIVECCQTLGLDVRVTDDAVRFGSALYGRLLERLCGSGSRNKHLPGFVFSAATQQLAALRDVLVAGDGNERATFYTTSDALQTAMLRVGVATGVKPRYTKRENVWRVYLRTGNDGFRTDHHLGQHPTDAPAYRLAVADYPTVLAGRDGKFQWIGVSGVG